MRSPRSRFGSARRSGWTRRSSWRSSSMRSAWSSAAFSCSCSRGCCCRGGPLARWSALAFFACSPVVLKTGAMFHPQPLAMLLSLLALTTTAWMVARRDYRLVLWAALALSLAGAQLVRSVSIWVVGVVLVTLVAAAIAQREHRRRIGSALALCALAIVLLPLPWYLHNQSTGGNAVFGRGMSLISLNSQWPAELLSRPRPAGRDHASSASRARGRAHPDPVRGDVGRLLRDLVLGGGPSGADVRGRTAGWRSRASSASR